MRLRHEGRFTRALRSLLPDWIEYLPAERRRRLLRDMAWMMFLHIVALLSVGILWASK